MLNSGKWRHTPLTTGSAVSQSLAVSTASAVSGEILKKIK